MIFHVNAIARDQEVVLNRLKKRLQVIVGQDVIVVGGQWSGGGRCAVLVWTVGARAWRAAERPRNAFGSRNWEARRA